MALPEWFNENGTPYPFQPANSRQYRGTRLKGTLLSGSVTDNVHITVQEWEQGIYHIACRFIHAVKKISIDLQEKTSGLRFEAVLSGELPILYNGTIQRLSAGQYHLTAAGAYTGLFKKGSFCTYFVSYYPDEMIREFGVQTILQPGEPRRMPEAMLHLLQEALHHPYEQQLHTLYYQNLVRDLFFIHLTSVSGVLPGELREADIAAVYEADAIMSKDLSEHFTIQQLSGMAGTNAFKLKKGFKEIFKTGVFGRLLFRRMEQAKVLLSTTNKPIKEVALEAGYETVAGFITAFRKRFGMTPLEWREAQREHK